jgi:hypothetical protein
MFMEEHFNGIDNLVSAIFAQVLERSHSSWRPGVFLPALHALSPFGVIGDGPVLLAGLATVPSHGNGEFGVQLP